MWDMIIVGAGPAGLSVGIEARRAGRRFRILERGNVVESLMRFPRDMQFFSSADLLEIGDVPFLCSGEKPNRREALAYYRRVADRYALPIDIDRDVTSVVRLPDGTFRVSAGGEEYAARELVLSTGYYHTPNLLGVPGEDLPQVRHYFEEPYPYYRKRVVVVGGANSAVEAAMECQRHGAASVTLVYRGEGLSAKVKPWVRPLAESLIRKGLIGTRFRSRVTAIAPDAVEIDTPAGSERLAADGVLLMTGYRPDQRFLRELGARIDAESGAPILDDRMMTTVPGLYAVGVLAAGYDANKIFIENSRFHGMAIFGTLPATGAAPKGG